MTRGIEWIAVVLAAFFFAAPARAGSPTDTRSATLTASETPSATATETESATASETATETDTATCTETPTATTSGTVTLTPTDTSTLSGSPSPTSTGSNTATVTVTHTPLASAYEAIAFPNPASPPYATFYFYVPAPGTVEIRIYNAAAALAASLSSPEPVTGYRTLRWDLDGVAPGMYAYEVRCVSSTGVTSRRYPFRRIAVLP